MYSFAKFLNLLDVYPDDDFAYLNPEGHIPAAAVNAFAKTNSQKLAEKEARLASAESKSGQDLGSIDEDAEELQAKDADDG